MSNVDFGQDTWCTDSVRTGRQAQGLELVGQALYRRFITPRGMLRGGEEEANYGLDIASQIGMVDDGGGAALESRVRAEAMKDERVRDAQVTISRSEDTTKAVSYVVTIRAITSAGPFTLRIGVSEVTTQLLGIEAEAA